MMVSVDGDRPTAYDKAGTDDRSFLTTHISNGIHEIKVWRTQRDNPKTPIAGSEFTSRYCVGPCPAIPHGHIGMSTGEVTVARESETSASSSKAVTLLNSGVAAMNWVLRIEPQACGATRYNGHLDAGASTTFQVFLRPSAAGGSSECKVTVLDHNADNSPQTITIPYIGRGNR
jgi:hypothetical protein